MDGKTHFSDPGCFGALTDLVDEELKDRALFSGIAFEFPAPRPRVAARRRRVLREELAFCRYDVESSPLKLVPKKILPRSPNRSDAPAMLFWEMDYAKLTAKPEDTSDITSPTRRRRERDGFAGSAWEE